MEITDYDANGAPLHYDIYPTYDPATKTLDLSLKAADLDLDNIQTFLDDGIADTPIDAIVYINPDNAVVELCRWLYLYHGDDDKLQRAKIISALILISQLMLQLMVC